MRAQPTAQQISEFVREFVAFLGGLANEGERALVIGDSARIDVALERLLKAVTHPCPGGRDDLFDADRPLGTFSAKIAAAYRLGLLDHDVESALHMIRRMRNEFAHATTPVTLSESNHRDRLNGITKCMSHAGLYTDVRQSVNNSMVQNANGIKPDISESPRLSLLVALA